MSYALSTIQVEVIRAVVTLAAAGLAAWVALTFFFRQKEYELIKQRYLEGGIDVIAADVENALGATSHNWARCLHLVKLYRDETSDFDPKELEREFLELDKSNFSRVAHHRIGALVGSQIIWQVYQLAFSYATNAN